MLNGDAHLSLKRGAGRSHVAARDHQRRAICEQPAVAQQGLGELKAEIGGKGGIEEIVNAVGRVLGRVEIDLNISSGFECLVVVELRDLVQAAQRAL